VTVIRQLMDASSRTGCSMVGEEPRQAQRLMHALQHPPGINLLRLAPWWATLPQPAVPRGNPEVGGCHSRPSRRGRRLSRQGHRAGLPYSRPAVHDGQVGARLVSGLGAHPEQLENPLAGCLPRVLLRQQSTLGSSSVRSVFGHYVAPARGRLRHAPCRLTYRTPNSSNAGLEHGRRPSRHHHENIKLPSEHCDALRCACSAGRNSCWQGGAVSQINHSVSGFSACQAQIAPLPILKTVPRSSRVACRSCGRVSFLNGLIGGGEKRIGQEHRQERRQEET